MRPISTKQNLFYLSIFLQKLKNYDNKPKKSAYQYFQKSLLQK